MNIDWSLTSEFNARKWAVAFSGALNREPSLATDEEFLTTFFACALLRGFEEAVTSLRSLEKSDTLYEAQEMYIDQDVAEDLFGNLSCGVTTRPN